jgi:hypothetical protein
LNRAAIAVLGLMGTVAACGGGEKTDPNPDAAAVIPAGCSDLFRQDVVGAYAFDIAPDDWSAIVAEFNNVTALAAGQDFATYHPITFHAGDESVPAAVKLHGQSSWLLAQTMDGDRAKMQFTVSFEEASSQAKFHGASKLVFDMPRSDWTFLHDRLAQAWLRKVGILAPCSTSAALTINGELYGLFVVEDNVGRPLIKQYFPDNAAGDIWKGGEEPSTAGNAAPNWDRKVAFWNATDLASVEAIVDVPGSLRSWAAEALLNDADGYYGGFHNFFIYDQGAAGFVFLPQDTDSTFDWLAMFDWPATDDHAVFWWVGRAPPVSPPGQHWVTVLSDPGQRRAYAEAIDQALGQWDVAELQGWLADWSRQIEPTVAADPRKWATVDQFHQAVQTAHDVIANRPTYLRSFIACERGDGADADGDGARWCDDCDDTDPSVHVGAPEICGNGKDDNCNAAVDEGCP